MNNNLIMQGTLEPGLLMDMLQVMNRRRTLSGYIEVTDEAVRGRIWLQAGALIAANWKDRQGELAIESMLRLKKGFFVVCESDPLPARTIFKDTVAVLMMCMRSMGRDSLTPVVPVRAVAVPVGDKISVSVSASTVAAAEALNPVATSQPVEIACKGGFLFLSGGYWRIAATILAVLIAGLGVFVGMKSLPAKKMASMVPAKQESPVIVPEVVVPVVKAPTLVHAAPIVHDVWPEIMLSALAASGKRNYCAILNGQLLGVGEQVDGVTVRSIRPNGVVLEYQGKRRFLCSAKPW